jgi:hypothetical protein
MVPESSPKPSRPFLGVHFKCCNVYYRIYLNKELTAFVGACPRCGRSVRILVAKDAPDARFFEVS